MDSQDQIRQVFDSMDKDKTGHINAFDLQEALSNGTDKPFNIKSCKLLIAMFDKDYSRTITFEEFNQLWDFVNGWVNAFQTFDKDNTGEINQYELNKLLNDLGYRLSDKFYTFIGLKYNLCDNQGIIFDDFLYICIMLHMLTGMFSNFDQKRTGQIELAYDQFLCCYMDVTSF